MTPALDDTTQLLTGGALVMAIGLLGRLVVGWINIILSERRELGGVFSDAMDRQGSDIKAQAEHIIRQDAELQTLRERLQASEAREHECQQMQHELMLEQKAARDEIKDLRQKMADLVSLLEGKT